MADRLIMPASGKTIAHEVGPASVGGKVLIVNAAGKVVAVPAATVTAGDRVTLINTPGKTIAFLSGASGIEDESVDPCKSLTVILSPDDPSQIRLTWVPGDNNDGVYYEVDRYQFSITRGAGQVKTTVPGVVTTTQDEDVLSYLCWHYVTIWGMRAGRYSKVALRARVFVPLTGLLKYFKAHISGLPNQMLNGDFENYPTDWYGTDWSWDGCWGAQLPYGAHNGNYGYVIHANPYRTGIITQHVEDWSLIDTVEWWINVTLPVSEPPLPAYQNMFRLEIYDARGGYITSSTRIVAPYDPDNPSYEYPGILNNDEPGVWQHWVFDCTTPYTYYGQTTPVERLHGAGSFGLGTGGSGYTREVLIDDIVAYAGSSFTDSWWLTGESQAPPLEPLRSGVLVTTSMYTYPQKHYQAQYTIWFHDGIGWNSYIDIRVADPDNGVLELTAAISEGWTHDQELYANNINLCGNVNTLPGLTYHGFLPISMILSI